ncbi:hypothetical protein H4219_002700 [Mycoemilia scoparia]|uniref:Uncharacterized protein n=1 Tax=Mycoemilia scoparia TaxID=417184 RepID=A0A9W8A1X4_9FUNG|nr:hypothetical protein H4219_002700 [Mycoemilia scoparia]
MSESFINWVHKFDSLSRHIQTLDDLSDSIVLFEICASIDPQWFKQIRSADIGDNWVLKFNNLKKLHRLIVRYYEEIIGYQTSRLEAPNLNAIAKDMDEQELLKLCHLVVTMAVQCENNEHYVGMIMQLDEEDQRSLMFAIESVMQQLGANDGQEDAGNTGHSDEDEEDPVTKLQGDLMRILSEKDEMEKNQIEIKEENDRLIRQYEDLLETNSDLKSRIKELEQTIAQSDKSGKADFILKAEIDSLKRDLDKSEIKRHETEQLLNDQLTLVTELKRKAENFTKVSEEAARLRDQLQEYKHAAEKLTKSEYVIEKYKKKLEESADLRRQVRSLEDQVTQLQTQNQQVEDEYRKRLQIRSFTDSSRDLVTELQTRNSELEEEMEKMSKRIKELEEVNKAITDERDMNADQISELQASLQDLELRGGNAEFEITPGQDLASFMDEDPIQLKNKISNLEKQLGEQKGSNKSDGKREVDFLESIVDEVTEERDKLKEEMGDLKKRYKEKEELYELEMADHQELKLTEEKLKNQLEETERQLSELQAKHTITNQTLEQTKQDLNKSKADLVAVSKEEQSAFEAFKEASNRQLETLKNEKENLETWYNSLEDEKERQSRRIEKLLSEKDELHTECKQSQRQIQLLENHMKELEDHIEDLKKTADSTAKDLKSGAIVPREEHQELKNQLRKSREEVHTLQIAMKKAKEHIKQQELKILDISKKSQQQAQSPQENYQEAIKSLQAQLSNKDEQLVAMKKILHEAHNQHKLEVQSMTSAWWYLQRQIERKSGFGAASSSAFSSPGHHMMTDDKTPNQSTSMSWLSQQRNTLYAQRSRH